MRSKVTTPTKNLTTEERLARIRGLLDGLAGTVRYEIPDPLREEIRGIAREVGIAEGIRCHMCGGVRDGEKATEMYADSEDQGLLCTDCEAKYSTLTANRRRWTR